MSELVETPAHSFRSKDGKYYASYNEMVDANIRHNEAFMATKGLDHTSMQRLKQSARPRPRPPAASKKRQALAVSNDGPRRRSTRQKHAVESENNESSSSAPSVIVDNIDIIVNILEQQEKAKAKKQKQALRSKAAVAPAVWQLSQADRLKLQHLPTWVKSMATYLLEEEHLSIPNQRSVMRQVEKLAAGLGVEYKRWGKHVFMQGIGWLDRPF
jgi:hypothetical protein